MKTVNFSNTYGVLWLKIIYIWDFMVTKVTKLSLNNRRSYILNK